MNDQNMSSPILPGETDILKARILELERQVSDAETVRESLAISEARYKTIIDNLRDVIFTNDVNGVVTYVTTSVGQYGYHPEDILGRNMLEFVHPDDWQLAMDVHNKLMSGSSDVSFEIRMLTQEGRSRVLEDFAKAVVSQDGKVIGVVGVLRDVTEKKAAEQALEKMNTELEKYVWQRTVELCKAEEALKKEGRQREKAEVAKDQSETLLAGMINFLPDPTFVIDHNSCVLVWNQAMEKLTGVPATDILGKGHYEYALPFYGERRPILIDFALTPAIRSDKEYTGVRQQGDTFTAEAYTPQLKNGRATYLWGIAKPYYDAQGRILGAIESIRDVTMIHNISMKLSKEVDKFRALYDLAVNMSAEKSLDENLSFIVKKSRALMATDIAYMMLVDEKNSCLVMHTHSGIKTQAFQNIRIPLDRGLGGLIIQTQKGRIIYDYFTNGEITPTSEDAVRGEGLQSAMAVPISAADKSLGVLFIANRKKTDFSQDDLDTLLLFGNLAAVEIVRQRAELNLKASEATYRTVFENTGTAMIIIENNGALALVNEEFARMTGFDKSEIEGKKKWKEFVYPEDIPQLAEASRKQILGHGEPLRQYQYRFQDRHGTPRYVSLNADIIPGMNKSVAALADITALKKVETDLIKARSDLENRVAQRTQQLTAANEGLKELLQKQDVNIDLAKNILAMINPRPSRHMFIDDRIDLFFTAFYLPCYAEGGDHFFIKNFSDRYPGLQKTTLSLKDQSGHEVSCILRSIVTDLIHNALLINSPDFTLEERISQLNKAICSLTFFGEQNFFTAINTELDHKTLKMRYVSAGHPPFLLIREQEVACLPALDDAGRNIPAGILKTIDFTAGEIQLHKGDKLIFYTDGFTDIPRRLGDPVFNADDLKDMTLSLIRENPNLSVSVLISRLFNRINGLEQNDKIVNFQGFDDDITILGLELEDHLHEFEDIIQPLNIDDFSACATHLYRKIKDEWQEKGFPAPGARLQMVLEEALTNAWKHGNQSDPAKKIIIRRRYANDAVLEVIDEGNGFDFETFYDPTIREHLLQENGRGNFIMRVLTEEVLWKEGGRHLLAFFSRQGTDVQKPKEEARFDLWRRLKRR